MSLFMQDEICEDCKYAEHCKECKQLKGCYYGTSDTPYWSTDGYRMECSKRGIDK